ncbi:MAG: hypothetical protein IKO56_02820, partial [Alphaproteobacteria bacterium]|nr:hypothetical protein [Alphaproteobacteria bacterium]
MKKERSFTYLTKDKSKKAVRAHHPHIFMMLMALAMMILPDLAMAQTVTTTYDFSASAYGTNGNDGNMTTNYSTGTIKIGSTNCTYFSEIGNVSNPERFAAQVTTFTLRKSSGSSPTYGLNLTGFGTNQYRMFVITNLYAGDVVTVNGSATFSTASGSSSATANGNTFTMNEKGSLALSIPGSGWIYTISIQHDISGAWGYDPAIETYDMYNENQNVQSNNLTGAGFPLDVNDYEAQFLTNLTSGLALNNRIAVSQIQYNNSVYTPWQFDHGLKSIGYWHNVSICDLKEGDRVVIYYTGSIKFSSKGENMAYNGCPAFKDAENNGDFDPNDDAEIALGMSVEAKESRWENNLNTTYYTSYPYVITEDGHLDLAVASDARICKIEIYGDHQAQMVDKDNLHDTNTSYFNTTGQLEAKHHIVPGGLH